MKILDRYILKGFALYFLGCSLSLVVIGTTFSGLAELDLLEEPNGRELFIEAILASLPLLIELVTPISVLLGTILCLSALSKTSEAVAIQAAGVSPGRMLQPIMLAGVIVALFLYFNQSYLAPWWGADQKVTLVKRQQETHLWRLHQKRLYYFDGLNKKRSAVRESKALTLNEEGKVTAVEEMKRLKVVKKGVVYDLLSGADFDDKRIQEREPKRVKAKQEDFPQLFNERIGHPRYVSFGLLLQEIRIKSEGGVNAQKELFALYQKVAGLLAVFVMMLLALPFSLFSGRAQNVRVGVVVSIVLGFTFWLADQIFASMFDAGLLPALLAGFLADLIFAGLGIYLIRTKKA